MNQFLLTKYYSYMATGYMLNSNESIRLWCELIVFNFNGPLKMIINKSTKWVIFGDLCPHISSCFLLTSFSSFLFVGCELKKKLEWIGCLCCIQTLDNMIDFKSLKIKLLKWSCWKMYMSQWVRISNSKN